ncbi:unnamed protein product [Fusarium equiseti]|uniref:Lipase 1 n=1 Tax=Fusarium equiseti TaxID=61235 RepID=A0A8J2NN72_FUSEQ|nr:unnamed protein product [Fusarium equiseti]
MTPLKWLRDLCAVAQAFDSTIDTSAVVQGWQTKQPGDVLRIRSVPILTEIVANSAAAYHILYRSTDSKNDPSWAVTTLFIPESIDRAPSGKAPLLSYQFAYNTANLDSAPSFALSGVMAKSEPTLGIKSSTSLIDEMMAFGWIVNTPDQWGPTSAFGASIQGGRATLDALKAAQYLLNLKKNPGYNTAIWGYSGGSIATFAAAELHKDYAPEVKIEGAVLGGLVDNISGDFDLMNKSPIAGTVIAFLLGVTSQYPEARKYLESRLVPATRAEFMSVLDLELTQAVAHFSGHDIYPYFENGLQDLKVPQLQELFDKQAKLGHRGIPTMPMFVYKAIKDQFCPIAWTDATVQKLCDAGAEITFDRNEIENGKQRVFGFLGAIFEEGYGSTERCNVLDVWVDASA